ncbi:hypothetical protein EWM57_19540, partial [Hymenobacter persicinus]
DDVYLPDKLAVQVPLLRDAPPEVGVIFGPVELIGPQGEPLPTPKWPAVPEGDIFLPLLHQNFVLAMGTLVRRSCYDKVGLYDENLPFEDWDMWLRLAKEYKFVYSPQVSARYRKHPGSVFDTRKKEMEEGSLLLLNKHRGCSKAADVAIKAQVRTRSELLYQLGGSHAAQWLRLRWQDDHSLQSLGLYLLAKLGISGRRIMQAQALLGRR